MKTKEQLIKASEHVWYEYLMLLYTAKAIDSAIAAGSNLHNALVESFVVHLRNLVHFLYDSKSDNDDVLATDYFQDQKEWTSIAGNKKSSVLEDAYKRAHKELAHLTYTRTSKTLENKNWDYMGLMKEIAPMFKLFVEKVPKKYFHSSQDDLKCLQS